MLVGASAIMNSAANLNEYNTIKGDTAQRANLDGVSTTKRPDALWDA